MLEVVVDAVGWGGGREASGEEKSNLTHRLVHL